MYIVLIYIIYLKGKEDIMPRFDKTGPRGEGPRTGRQMGDCEPKTNENEETERVRPRRFFGLGRGRGAGGFRGRNR